MQPILELTNISKRFPGVQALKNVRFDVLPGEVHALIGENGAGKSTLIKIISGVYRPDEGMVKMHQKEREPFHSPRDAQAAGIATIYQELSLYPELSAAENIFMGHAPRTRLGAVDWPEMRRQAREILASLEIHNLDVNRKVGTLSVGNRQRIEIAKALSLNARVLIMDEPTAALTEADVEQLFRIVRLLQERGVAIIYISHRLQEVFALADRVTVLRDGEYVATRPVADITERDLISMMVGRTIDDMFPKLPATIGEPRLEIRDLWRKPFTLGVSLTVHAGEIVGVAGLVGSGRSELAQAIFGITPPQSGQIAIDGRPVKIRHPGDAMKLGIAYVPEERGSQGLIRQMNIRENVSLAILRQLTRGPFIDRAGDKTLAQRTIDQLNIRAYSINQVVNKLSGGNQQKVVIGKWLACQPRILIMDEPTRGIDVGAKAEVHRLMSQLAQQGMAVLMISSELPEILGMSDRIVVMREGEVVGEFAREEATQEKIATAMMSVEAGNGGADVASLEPATAASGDR
ncbi:MAG TPA: sugar ABC transporter ATP-binding protein [Aggregatilineaceae bacterium]|nr:sugar ABC transporter ATP-binding protein [Anaerolineae bacterium]HMM28006.1 sugar ABC transporter ATP-binding protein [Aggregatilineaceae bacterium]